MPILSTSVVVAMVVVVVVVVEVVWAESGASVRTRAKVAQHFGLVKKNICLGGTTFFTPVRIYILRNIPTQKFTPKHRNIAKLPEIYPKIWKYTQKSGNIPKSPKVYQKLKNVTKKLKIYN